MLTTEANSVIERLDKVLEYFISDRGNSSIIDVKTQLNIDADISLRCILQLLNDNYIYETLPGRYQIIAKGELFYANGGYRKLYIEQEETNRLQKEQITSVINTNLSVKKTNRFQIMSLVVTGVAIIGSLLFQKCSYDVLREDFIIKKEQLKDTLSVRIRQESLSASIDSIHKSLDTISSKIQRRK